MAGALAANPSPAHERRRIELRGCVQGVGFRPFVYRIARSCGLRGWVSNSNQGATIEVEGAPLQIRDFLVKLHADKPARCSFSAIATERLQPAGDESFEIRASDRSGLPEASVPADIATCHECVEETFTPGARRYLYPFTNCASCGPRYTIIERLPYDRANTAMQKFAMCDACRAEYEDPSDRRFHAQPIACPACGPTCEWWDAGGHVLTRKQAALAGAAQALKSGAIVAVKGLGGFHLMADARNADAVRALRQRKGREAKPFAILAPSLDWVREHARADAHEREWLLSPEAPIVLLERKDARAEDAVADGVAPGNPDLGVMLPSTPLHRILMRLLNFPVVATSGNRSDEPICTDGREALRRLRGIADFYLTHDRPILRPVDDSVVRRVDGKRLVLRRARGLAPLPIAMPDCGEPFVATGAHLKNAVALYCKNALIASPHIGDLDNSAAVEHFEHTLDRLMDFYRVRQPRWVCDTHPDYYSSRFAREKAPGRVIEVQHHYAHVRSAMADRGMTGSVLGVAWDGTGAGPDGTVWGGEFLSVTDSGFTRLARLRPFLIPGHEVGADIPARAAVGILHGLHGADAFDVEPRLHRLGVNEEHRRAFLQLLERRSHCMVTSSAGRLFDAVSALLGLAIRNRFEGEAAMALESAARRHGSAQPYAFDVALAAPGNAPFAPAWELDWRPMLSQILEDIEALVPARKIAARFHETLAAMILAAARKQAQLRVVLSGGCFQNRMLSETAAALLRANGFQPVLHRDLPPNDGGIAAGQIEAARIAALQRSAPCA